MTTTGRMTKIAVAAAVALSAGTASAATLNENTSPHVMKVLGQEVLMASEKRATGAPFTDAVAAVTLAPHVEVASDGTVNASCVATGVASHFRFTNSDDQVTHPERYNSGYVRVGLDVVEINEALFQAGFPANDPSIISDGQAIDAITGGTMPNGQGISIYMIQPTSDAYVEFEGVIEQGGTVTVNATSQFGNKLDALYDFATASQASQDCEAFLNDPDAIADLAENASHIVTVETEKVSKDELVASGYDSIEKQRAFKQSLMGQSCTDPDFTDAQLDDVNVVRVVLETGKESTSRFGIQYMEDGKTITAIGDYYKRVEHPNGMVEESFSPSTDNPTITSCAGTVTATTGDQTIISLLEPAEVGQRGGGVYNGPFIGGSAGGFGGGASGGFGGGGGGGSSSGGDDIFIGEVTNICSVVDSTITGDVSLCNEFYKKVDIDVVINKPHDPVDVAPIPLPVPAWLLLGGLGALGAVASRRPKGLKA